MSAYNGISRNLKSKTIQRVPVQERVAVPEWQRPSDWLALPDMLPTDNQIAMLVTATEYGNNKVGFMLWVQTTGASFTVDWGDGTVEDFVPPVYTSTTTFYTAALTMSHTYDYDSLSPSTETSRGERQAVITITMTTGYTVPIYGFGLIPTITQLGYGSSGIYNQPIVDLKIAAPSMTLLNLQNNLQSTSVAWLNKLEHIEILSWDLRKFDYLFSYMLNLKKIEPLPVANNVNTVTTIAGMFRYCSSLLAVSFGQLYFPNYLTGTYLFDHCYALMSISNSKDIKINNIQYMFDSCYSLSSLPMFNITKTLVLAGTNTCNNCYSLNDASALQGLKLNSMTNMFTLCKSLPVIPFFNTTSCTTFSAAFGACYSITTVPYFDTSAGTVFDLMFQNCNSLVSVPKFDLSSATSTYAMFQGCASLLKVPEIDFSSIGNTSTMFANCTSLTTLGNINTTNSTNHGNIFFGCSNLASIDNLDCSNSTNTLGMFNTCSSLESIPDIDFSKTTTLANTFRSTSSLTTIDTISAPLCITTFGMFYQSGIVEIGNISTPTNANSSQMFFTASSLISIDNINLGNTANCNQMFYNTYSLNSIPPINMTSVTNFGTTGYATTSGVNVDLSYNRKVTHGYGTSALSVDGFNYSVYTLGVASLQTLTISSTPAAAVASVSGSITGSSGAYTCTLNSGSPQVGWYMLNLTYNPNSRAGTVDTSLDTISIAGMNFSNSNGAVVSCLSTRADLTTYTPYYIVNGSGTSFQLSLTPGGSPIDLTVATSVNLSFAPKIIAIDGSTLTLDIPAAAATSGSVTTFRPIATQIASAKGWTLTG